MLFYTLRIPYGAYAPGQMVNYALNIRNQAMTDTEGYTLKFSQKQTFIAHSPRRKERYKKIILVQQQYNERCLRLSTRVFERQFRIPSVPPSTTDPNAIIKVEYKLKVTILLSGCHSNTDMKIPILIGTIPLMESVQVEPALEARVPEAFASAPELENSEVGLPPSYKDLSKYLMLFILKPQIHES